LNSKKKIAIIFGGQSTEHDVSVISASSISKAIDKNLFDPVFVAIDKNGRWHLGPMAFDFLKTGKTDGLHRVILSTDPEMKGFISLNDGTIFQTDVIFPVLHGPRGEDGTVQGMMDLAGLAYVGCGTTASAIAMDKDLTKRILKQQGLPVVHGTCVARHEWKTEREEMLREIKNSIEFPVFVKPATMGSSIGIVKAKTLDDAASALDNGFFYSHKVLVEQAVISPLEVEVAILGNNDPKASVPGQIIPAGEFYDFDAKYVDDSAKLVIPAGISSLLSERVQLLARESFLAIGGTGLARIDFLVSGDTTYINEINTLPGFTSISMYPKLWEATGIGYTDLITRLIELALQRFNEEEALTKTIVLEKALGV
jgi:D-alanine-D-alanine ligase